MITTQNLAFSYNGLNSFVFPDMKCQKGEHWLIMGPSGCGKTTLLHLMAGLLSPAKGTISVDGFDYSKFKQSQLDKFRGRHIGIVFQNPHFIQSLTVAENLLIARYLSGAKGTKEEVNTLLNPHQTSMIHTKP